MKCKVCCQTLSATKYNKLFDDRYGYPGYFDMLKCLNCGLFQTDPGFNSADVVNLYSNFYPRQISSVKDIANNFKPDFGWQSKVKNWFSGNHRLQYLLNSGTGKILEVGCGDGRSLLQLKAAGYEVFGLEVDDNVKELNDIPGVSIELNTIENCSYPDNFFDYIIANQLVEHLIDLDSFIIKAKQLLKPGGLIIFSTPNINSFYRHLFKNRWINWHLPYHQQIFTKKSLSLLAKKYDLKINKIYTVSPINWTLHQWSALKHPAQMGVKFPYWNKTINQSNVVNKNKSYFSLKKVVFLIAVFITNIFNRLLDFTGFGDCLICYYKK